MKKLFRNLKLYKEYKKAIREHEEYLLSEYGLERNNFNELFTTITLIDAPQELVNKFGLNVLIKKNIKEFLEKLDTDSEKLNLNELLKIYETKKLNEYEIGVTIGFKPINSRRITLIKTVFYLVLVVLTIFGIKIII
jgi:hypothetical protein